MKRVKIDHNNTFKLRFHNICETMKLAGGENILISEQRTNNGSQESMKKKQYQISQMKSICFLLSADHKRYIFLLKYLRCGNNMVRDKYLVTATLDLGLLICTEVGICRNQKSNYDNCGSRGGCQQKAHMVHTFNPKRQGGTHRCTK